MSHLINYRQQDCQEFLRLFLDSLSEDLYRSTNNAIDSTKTPTTPLLPSTVKTNGTLSPNISKDTSISESITDQFRLPSTQKSSSFSPRLTNPRIITSSHSNKAVSPIPPSDPPKFPGENRGSPKSLYSQYEVDFDTLDEKELATGQNPDDHPVDQKQTSDAVKIETEPISAKQAWESYYKASSSIIVDLFSGQLHSRIECSVCKNSSNCFDPFMELSLPIPPLKPAGAPSSQSLLRMITPTFMHHARVAPTEVSKCTLQECMDLFTAEEILDGDNM